MPHDRVRAGRFFGEIALLDDTVRIGNIRTRTAVEVLVMGKEVFSKISRALTPFHNLVAQARSEKMLRWLMEQSRPDSSGS